LKLVDNLLCGSIKHHSDMAINGKAANPLSTPGINDFANRSFLPYLEGAPSPVALSLEAELVHHTPAFRYKAGT
jgi:hypothetical protein